MDINIIHELNKYQQKFATFFRTKTRNLKEQALQYLKGKFIEKGRGNMTSYARNIEGTNNQRVQHFISDSPWDEKPVIDQIQLDVTNLIGDKTNSSIHIDESGFKKDGKDSVGVKRQYLGRLGKIEKCQMGVFLGYANGNRRTLIDERLYLPEDWANDPIRRKKCGVPDDIVFKTKAQLGLEMLLEAQKRGVPFAWVGMDCFYGEQPWLLDEIASKGMVYIADIPCDTQVWLEKPRIEIPEKKGENITKYQLSNAPADTSIERLGQMSCSRFWIERALEDGKGEAGLADYQVRGWTGWHHHMVMTLLAMLFILEMVVKWGKKAEMISVQDVKYVLEVILPKKKVTEKEILAIIEGKHQARLSARKSHHRKNGFGV